LLSVPTVEIALTRAPSSTPVSASSVTLADWPSLTWPMSDSLSATVIDIVLLLTISANGVAAELEEDADEPELPSPPAVVPVVVPVVEADEVPLLDVEDAEAVPVEPDDTLLPAVRLASDTIVPLIGA